MTALRTRSLQWFEAQQTACQPRPACSRALCLEPTSDTRASLHPTMQIRLWRSFRAVFLLSIPSPLPRWCWLLVRAQRRACWQPSRRSLAAIPDQSSLRYWEDIQAHTPSPECNPESAVTGRQRYPGHRRSQQEGASGTQGPSDPCLKMAKGSEGHPGAAQPCSSGHRAAFPKENM